MSIVITILQYIAALLGGLLVLAFLLGPPLGVTVLFARVIKECKGRIHLSTLVLLSIVLAAFLGLNLTRHSGADSAYTRNGTIDGDSVPANTVFQDVDYSYAKLADGDYNVDDGVCGDFFCIAWNLLLALTALLYTCRYNERRIRRRELISIDPMKKAPLKGALS